MPAGVHGSTILGGDDCTESRLPLKFKVAVVQVPFTAVVHCPMIVAFTPILSG